MEQLLALVGWIAERKKGCVDVLLIMLHQQNKMSSVMWLFWVCTRAYLLVSTFCLYTTQENPGQQSSKSTRFATN